MPTHIWPTEQLCWLSSELITCLSFNVLPSNLVSQQGSCHNNGQTDMAQTHKTALSIVTLKLSENLRTSHGETLTLVVVFQVYRC